MPPLAASPRSQTLLAISLLLAGGLLFTIGGAMIKMLDPGVTPTQMVFFRAVPGLIPVLIYLQFQGGFGALRTTRPLAHLYRVAVGLGSMIAGYYAIRLIALADFVAINFGGPIFATALAAVLLREAVGWRRWAAVLAGFAGVLMIAQPGGQGLNEGALYAIVGAVGYGLVIVAMRDLGRTEKAITTAFYFTLGMLVFSCAVVPFQWAPLSTKDWFLLVGLGLLSSVAQILVTEAYRHGRPAVISPFDYVSMVWALLFGLLLFGTFPNALALAGTAVVIAAGIYIVYRETVRGQPKPRVPAG